MRIAAVVNVKIDSIMRRNFKPGTISADTHLKPNTPRADAARFAWKIFAMPAPIKVHSIDHVTLIVKDIAASRNFYVNQLGMVEVERPKFDFNGAWFQAGATLIHLIEEHDRSGPAGFPGEVLRRSSRNHHFAFLVDDAHEAAARVKELGLPLVDDAKLRPDGAVQVFVEDPDGHVVELTSGP